jgi:hypothetical protein
MNGITERKINSDKPLASDEFVSRLTGEIIKKNGRKSLREQPDNNPNIDAFKLLGETFKVQEDDKSLKYLYMEWNFPHETINKIFKYFVNSFDDTNDFLNILDGCDSLEEAWSVYQQENDLFHEPFPF